MTAIAAFTALKAPIIAALATALPALRSALLALPLLLVTLACLPALAVLPLPAGRHPARDRARTPTDPLDKDVDQRSPDPDGLRAGGLMELSITY
ncbi:hypothetical protein [Streptomyces sp. KL116D]|uniref:hypothetical protein n=1 Tax=Streptomyces sp. KL116D TaxID=3045152 RepID=UPI003555CF33